MHLCVRSVVITDNDHTLMPCRSSSSTRFTSSMRRTSCCTSLRCGALALYDALTARSDPAPSFATQACVYCPVTSAVFAEQLGHCQRGAQEKYNFKAHTFHAAGFANRDEYRAAHGSDLYMTDIEEYDRICKVNDVTARMASRVHQFLREYCVLSESDPRTRAVS